MRTKIILAVASVIAIITLSACETKKTEESRTSEKPSDTLGEMSIEFEFTKQSGWASNQFAAWIEDADGGFVKTIYATKFTAAGGYEKRPACLPVWVEKSGAASKSKSDVDAITGATPKSGKASYVWNLTDESGTAVPAGEYKFFVEGSLRWENRVLYSGTINAGGESVTVDAEAEYFYEASDDGEALNADSEENGMISDVKASYTPSLNND